MGKQVDADVLMVQATRAAYVSLNEERMEGLGDVSLIFSSHQLPSVLYWRNPDDKVD
jgi:hypothetical protein